MTVNFKKTLVSGLMAASLAAVSFGSMAASVPVDVPVTFTGTILDNTCDTVSVGDSGVVAFGTISQSDFRTSGGGVGAVGATKPFTINFSGCGTQADDVEVWFVGDTSNTVHALDNTSAEGNAENVGVQVYGGTSADILLKSDDTAAKAAYTGALTASGTGSVDLVAKVVQTTETTPTLGALNAQGTLVVQYP